MLCARLFIATAVVLLLAGSGDFVAAQGQDVPPIVVMHGILGTSAKMQPVLDWIREILPEAYVRSIEVGNGALDSVFMPLERQVELFCEAIYADKNLERGFNVIGFSQGGLVTRGYLQRCNKYPVINFISWASPQGGQFGGMDFIVPGIVSVLLNAVPYEQNLQKSLSLFQYWRDPYNLDMYREKSLFIADMNNEREVKNATYKKNVESLKTMMLLYSVNDEVVHPARSAWFESFLPYTGPGDKGVVVPLEKSFLYTQDWLGLRTLHRTGRLQRHQGNCTHESHPTDSCKHAFDLFTAPLLKQPWDAVEAFWSNLRANKVPVVFDDTFVDGQ